MTSPAVASGPQPLSEDDRRMYRGAIWLVILAESMIFVTLFSTRFLLAGMDREVEPTNPLGLAITALLIVSLLPAWRGLSSIASGDVAAMSRSLSIAAVLGLAALVAIVYDWMTLSFSPSSPFGENYVISTGYHALHILLGGVWLAAAAVAGSRGAHTKDNHWVVEGGVRFWTFIVVMWIALYVVFFVL